MSIQDTEKKIAGVIAGWFGKGKAVEQKVVHEVSDFEKRMVDKSLSLVGTVENALETVKSKVIGETEAVEVDINDVFSKVRQDALDANKTVNDLKAALQDALAKSRDLHQAAVDAANAAASKAEADLAKFKQLAAAHASDMNVQASQIITPAAPAIDTTPVADTPQQ